MYKKQLMSFFGMALALMVMSCERLDEPLPTAGTFIDYRTVAEEIPLAHGRFVSATTFGQNGAMLWFERPDQTVIGVYVSTSRGTISETIINIPRH
jgi:hypothetical protein